ncbi:hypothetical protein BAE44_0019638 [Dichanthelium oligosanthes]|uniref:KIB1-4 beta-propeller domain-containing protein n=1 Tax=Dichanthelium oligosanthes TaxID=888268 RepID=A0A1E5V2F4_9POAL|nr:hypothetical protein BAE44_0019638 [Dichanthelium oligosanthes]
MSRLPAPGDPDHSAWLPRRLHQRQKKVEMGAPPAGLPHCCGASRGWLALADDLRSPTRDPASGAEVPLPCLRPVTEVFLSGDPLGWTDWIAVASQRLGEFATKSFFWRPGDAAWSPLYEQPTAGVARVVFHGGRVFYITTWARGGSWPCGPALQVRARDALLSRGAPGELLLVVLRGGAGRRGGRPPPPPPRGSSPCSSFAEVDRLDWTPEGRPQVGERVTDLGEHSLFLGLSESFALSVKEFPAVRRNHIYCLARNWNYSRNREHKLSDWAFVFDLGSETLEGIPYPEELRDDEINWWPRSWLCLRSPLMTK